MTALLERPKLDSIEDMFHFVVDKLIVQQKGKRSITSAKPTCRYRGNNGCRCAVGWLIPDEAYNSSFEGWNIVTLLKGPSKYLDCPEQDTLIRLFEKHTTFLQDLQHAHDRGHTPEHMKKQFKELARKYNFEIPDCLKDVEV